MPENLQGAFVRRQELVCTEDELAVYGNKILLKNEVLYISMNDGTWRIKIGDGQTAVKNLGTIGELPHVSTTDNNKVLMVKDGAWSAGILSSLERVGSVTCVPTIEYDMYYLGDVRSLWSPMGSYADEYGGGDKEISRLISNSDIIFVECRNNDYETIKRFIGSVGISWDSPTLPEIAVVDCYKNGFCIRQELANAIFAESTTLCYEVTFTGYKLPNS